MQDGERFAALRAVHPCPADCSADGATQDRATSHLGVLVDALTRTLSGRLSVPCSKVESSYVAALALEKWVVAANVAISWAMLANTLFCGLFPSRNSSPRLGRLDASKLGGHCHTVRKSQAIGKSAATASKPERAQPRISWSQNRSERASGHKLVGSVPSHPQVPHARQHQFRR
jgi:hypothetical protein